MNKKFLYISASVLVATAAFLAVFLPIKLNKTKDNNKITQYCFCYKGIYKGMINKDKFVCIDNDNQYFYWVDIEQLNSYKVYPESTIKLIRSEKLKHIIENND